MKSKLGIYVTSLNGVDAVGYATQSHPRIIVSMDHNVETWRAVKNASPNTFIIGRHYVDDRDQHYDNPEADAQNFFDAMQPDAEKMRGIYDAWMSYNEINPLDADQATRLSRFHVRWGDVMRAANLVSAAYSFSTGTPMKGDPKPGGGGNEPNFWPILADGLRHCDLLSLHEYSAPKMDNMQPYLCLRYRGAWNALPPDARKPIVITECGIDGGPMGQAQDGWSKFTNAAGYLATLQWYDSELQKDDYVIGATIFAANGWGNDGSFGMINVQEIRDYLAQGGSPSPVSIKLPTIVTAPPVIPPVVTPTQSTPATPPVTPRGATTTYTVQAGDTLFKIAQKYGTTVALIVAANNIADPNLIKPGQVLKIPGK